MRFRSPIHLIIMLAFLVFVFVVSALFRKHDPIESTPCWSELSQSYHYYANCHPVARTPDPSEYTEPYHYHENTQDASDDHHHPIKPIIRTEERHRSAVMDDMTAGSREKKKCNS